MIVKVSDKKQLKNFLYYITDLYKDCENYVFPVFASLKKEVGQIVLVDKTYTAILCIKDDKIVGRLLYTIGDSKQKNGKIGYFSYFDCINDETVAKELFDFMENDLKTKVTYIEGTFSPFDSDTRRGVLVKGYDKPHTILTSYNYDYYEKLLISCGYAKAYDTFTFSIPFTDKNFKLTKLVGESVTKHFDIRVDSLDFKNLDRDIKDVHNILSQATTEANYQEAPSLQIIQDFAKNVKHIINPNFVKIARENGTNKPIGFCLTLPDFNQILAKTKGKINPFLFLTGKNKIDSVRGVLQYVIPEYQKTGLLILIYNKTYEEFLKYNIKTFEGGTILENNKNAWSYIIKLGGELTKIYRIFGKDII
ncbi:MAG: hypothetical protein WCR54_05040 [Clostridia bacterium]